MRQRSGEVEPSWSGFWLIAGGVTLAVACNSSTFSAADCNDDACAGGAGEGTGGRGGRDGASGAGGSEGGAPDTGGTGGTGGATAGGGRGGSGGKSASNGGAQGSTGGSGATAGAPGGMSGTDHGGSAGSGGGKGGGGGAANGGAGGGGGVSSGGAPAGGGPAAGAGGGGMGGAGSPATGGVAGLNVAGGISAEFPTTPVLDSFNREGPDLGANWIGSTGNYAVADQRLECSAEYCPAALWDDELPVAQEVFATLTGFDERSLEINLVLKAQGDPDCDMLEIMYSPPVERILVEACWGSGWSSLGTMEVALAPGDQVGARARDDGYVEVYKNGALVGTVNAAAYPYIGLPGYIGVNGVVIESGEPDVWDDFGGGGL